MHQRHTVKENAMPVSRRELLAAALALSAWAPRPAAGATRPAITVHKQPT
jgi:hypothetical protein